MQFGTVQHMAKQALIAISSNVLQIANSWICFK